MQKYLMRKATENVTVTVKATGAQFKGAELRRMLEKLGELDNYWTSSNDGCTTGRSSTRLLMRWPGLMACWLRRMD